MLPHCAPPPTGLATVRARRGVALVAAAVIGAGCGRNGTGAVSRATSDVPPPATSPLADTASMLRLVVRPPGAARAWLAHVAVAPADPAAVPPPPPTPDSVIPESVTPPVLVMEPGLVPPRLVGPAPMAVPPPGEKLERMVSVELEVRVSANGDISDVRFAGGSKDPGLVAAALACARAMRFEPARLDGRAVAVWCHQRFDFGPASR